MRYYPRGHALKALALVALGLGGALFSTPAAAIDCAKASSNVEKRICANPTLKSADLAMGQAYAALLKRAPDAEIRTMLVKSQRRWIEARDKGLNVDMNRKQLPLSEVRDAIADRTRQLSDASENGFIAIALEQRRYFAQFPAAQFSGFDTYCDFVPASQDSTHFSYSCFGGVHVQKGPRLCDLAQDWATYALYVHYGVSRIANGGTSPQAYCDGQSEHGCDAGSPDWQIASDDKSFSNFPKPENAMDKIDAEGISPFDADYADWFKACVSSPNFPR